MHYIIIHQSGKSYLGRSGWVSSFHFARRFNSFTDVNDFIGDCSLHEQGVVIGRVTDHGYGPEVEIVID